MTRMPRRGSSRGREPVDGAMVFVDLGEARPLLLSPCYTEKAPNAWQRRGTKKTRNTYNQPNRPNRQTAQTKHRALPSFLRVPPKPRQLDAYMSHAHRDAPICTRSTVGWPPSSYKRVKGRSHTVEKRISMLPHKPHVTSQPSRFSHTPRLGTDSPPSTCTH